VPIQDPAHAFRRYPVQNQNHTDPSTPARTRGSATKHRRCWWIGRIPGPLPTVTVMPHAEENPIEGVSPIG